MAHNRDGQGDKNGNGGYKLQEKSPPQGLLSHSPINQDTEKHSAHTVEMMTSNLSSQ